MNNPALKNTPVYTKATWVAAYAQPEVNKGLRAISYNQFMINYWRKKQSGPKDNRIGTMTGNYTEQNGKVWIEIVPAYCNRLKTAWVRVQDVKLADGAQIDIKKKSKNTLGKLVLGALTVYGLLS